MRLRRHGCGTVSSLLKWFKHDPSVELFGAQKPPQMGILKMAAQNRSHTTLRGSRESLTTPSTVPFSVDALMIRHVRAQAVSCACFFGGV